MKLRFLEWKSILKNLESTGTRIGSDFSVMKSSNKCIGYVDRVSVKRRDTRPGRVQCRDTTWKAGPTEEKQRRDGEMWWLESRTRPTVETTGPRAPSHRWEFAPVVPRPSIPLLAGVVRSLNSPVYLYVSFAASRTSPYYSYWCIIRKGNSTRQATRTRRSNFVWSRFYQFIIVVDVIVVVIVITAVVCFNWVVPCTLLHGDGGKCSEKDNLEE